MPTKFKIVNLVDLPCSAMLIDPNLTNQFFAGIEVKLYAVATNMVIYIRQLELELEIRLDKTYLPEKKKSEVRKQKYENRSQKRGKHACKKISEMEHSQKLRYNLISDFVLVFKHTQIRFFKTSFRNWP